MPDCVYRLSLCIQQPEQLRSGRKMAPLCGTTPRQALLCKHDNAIYIVTNFVLAVCHAQPVCCDLTLHWKSPQLYNSSMPQCIACSRSLHNVLHSPSYKFLQVRATYKLGYAPEIQLTIAQSMHVSQLSPCMCSCIIVGLIDSGKSQSLLLFTVCLP